MPRLRAWFSRLLGLFSKNRRDAEMAEEIQAHLDLLTERNIAAGMSPNEARNAALRLFGGIEQTKEIAREQRVWRWADEFVQDIRYGVRMLRRTPGFSILAILCLTLGIGTNAAALSWIEGILIRPYPLVAHQDRMFALNCTTRGAEGFTGLSYPDFLDLERNSTLFESFIVDRITGHNTQQRRPRRARGRRNCVRELFRRARRSTDSRPRIQARRRNRTQCAPGRSHKLHDVEESLQRRS